jgi:hypothetical protein
MITALAGRQIKGSFYPPNSGFLGAPQRMKLPVGLVLDRVGDAGGRYLSPAGTPFEDRALPPWQVNDSRTGYVVTRDGVYADVGVAAPWGNFGSRGGAIQIKLQGSVRNTPGLAPLPVAPRYRR